DDYGEADGHLGRRHREDEEDEDVPGLGAVEAGERDERQGRGDQHELEAHVDHKRVAAHEDPEEPDREQGGAQEDVGVERGSHSVASLSVGRRLRTMTPSMATRSRKPITSTGSRYVVKS